jgi:hypothetical protein
LFLLLVDTGKISEIPEAHAASFFREMETACISGFSVPLSAFALCNNQRIDSPSVINHRKNLKYIRKYFLNQ